MIKFGVLKLLFVSILILSNSPLFSQELDILYSSQIHKLKPKNKPSGLLLGFKTLEGYRTILLEHSNNEVKITADIPVLATPQKNGFCYIIQTFNSEYFSENNDSSYIVESETKPEVYKDLQSARAAAEKNAKSKDKENLNGTVIGNEETDESIIYMLPNIISLNRNFSSFYQGGAHPMGGSSTEVLDFEIFCDRSNDTIVQRNKRPFELYPIYERVNDSINLLLVEKGEKGDFVDGDSPSSVDTSRIYFSIKRSKGQVHLYCYANAFASYAQSGDYAFTAMCDLGPIPNTYLPNNKRALNFDLLFPEKGYSNNYNDILVSPTQDIIYFLTADNSVINVKAIDVKGRKEIANYRIENVFYVLMTEWATGENVAKWKDSVSK